MPSARWRTEKLSERAEFLLSCRRSPSTVIPPYARDCPISSFLFEGGARYRRSGIMPSSRYSIKRRIGQSAATTGAPRSQRTPLKSCRRSSFAGSATTASAWGSCRRSRVVPDEPFYLRYDVCDLSGTGVGAEETKFVVYMLYRPYQSVRLRWPNPPLDSTRPMTCHSI